MTGLKKKAFTMVELIIVIAIIAFLAVSATIVLTKFIWKSRDSRRLSDIGVIDRAITTFLADSENNPTWTLPTTNLAKIYINTWWGATTFWTISYQGKFDINYLSGLDAASKSWKFTYLWKLPSDPKWANFNYIIATDWNWQKKFNVWATLEYQSSDVVWNKAAVAWNFSSWDKPYLSVVTQSLTWVGSLLISWSYNTDWTIYTLQSSWALTQVFSTWASTTIDNYVLSATWFMYDWSTLTKPY